MWNGDSAELVICYSEGVSLRYLSIETPAIKKIPPKMVSAQGLNETILFPKMPKTPKIKAIMPPKVKISANIRIIK